MTNARADVMARIRRALGPAPAAPTVPKAYRGAGAVQRADENVTKFAQRLADYRATAVRASSADLEATVSDLCAARGARRVAAAAGAVAPNGIRVVADEPRLTARELDALDGVITGCALAIAETGTIVLDGSPACGRRALTLVPDYHICIVRTGQIVASVPDAIAALRPAADTSPITLISGPSATSDIEFDRVEGVHGPRVLDVIILAED